MQLQNKLISNYLTSNCLKNVTLEVYSLSLHLERSDYSLERSDYLVERSDQKMEQSDRNSGVFNDRRTRRTAKEIE